MKLKQEYEGKNGWTRWICPKRSGYRLICCDCGLSHDVQFKLNDIGKRGKQILFRFRRNNRSTSAIRRSKNKLTK